MPLSANDGCHSRLSVEFLIAKGSTSEPMKKPESTPKKKLTDAEYFLYKLGNGATYPLSRVAAALYAAGRATQTALLESLKSGQLVASVFWPDPTESLDLPKTYWAQLPRFKVRERNAGSWCEYEYVLHRGKLNRILILPRLKGLRDRYVHPSSDGSKTDTLSFGAELQEPDKGIVLDTAIAALNSPARAEVCVTRANAEQFARRYFGSLALRGRGRPPYEQKHLLLEAFARLYENYPRRPKQDAFAEELAKWNMQHDGQGEPGWVRKEILTPIWKALKIPED